MILVAGLLALEASISSSFWSSCSGVIYWRHCVSVYKGISVPHLDPLVESVLLELNGLGPVHRGSLALGTNSPPGDRQLQVSDHVFLPEHFKCTGQIVLVTVEAVKFHARLQVGPAQLSRQDRSVNNHKHLIGTSMKKL